MEDNDIQVTAQYITTKTVRHAAGNDTNDLLGKHKLTDESSNDSVKSSRSYPSPVKLHNKDIDCSSVSCSHSSVFDSTPYESPISSPRLRSKR